MTEFRLDGMRRPWHEREAYLIEQHERHFSRRWRRCVWPAEQRLWLVLVVGGYAAVVRTPQAYGAQFGEAAWMLQSDHIFGARAVALGLETFRA